MRNELEQEDGTEKFSDDPRRPEWLAQWGSRRDTWAKKEIPTRDALRVFEQFHTLHSRFQREGEAVELVLGDGHLLWARPEGAIRHPLVLQKLQLAFEPDVPQFTLEAADTAVDFYSSIFRALPDVKQGVATRYRQVLEAEELEPLSPKLDEWLRRLAGELHARGEFVGTPPTLLPSYPQTYRDPVIFVRQRAHGYAAFIEAALEDMKTGKHPLPRSLVQIAGVEQVGESHTKDTGSPWKSVETENILLSKPVNRQQLAVIDRLEHHDSVIAQGPPGTGKTHMIGNLIGHLLANGKSVLVTAHTSKALRVLRDKIPDEVQSLSVSVLDSDAESRRQLQLAVEAIVDKLANEDPAKLEREAETLALQRRKLQKTLAAIQEQILTSYHQEYSNIVVDGREYSPIEAAKFVHEGIDRLDWIPGSVVKDSPMPLTDEQIRELYRTNSAFDEKLEEELQGALPALEELPDPGEFTRLVNSAREADIGRQQEQLLGPHQPWSAGASTDASQLEEITREMQAVFGLFTGESWQSTLAALGAQQEGLLDSWRELALMIEQATASAASAMEWIYRYGPELAQDHPLEEQISVLQHILETLKEGEQVSPWQRIRYPAWRRWIPRWRVQGIEPKRWEHFRAILALAERRFKRQALADRWIRQVADTLPGIGRRLPEERPEVEARRLMGVFEPYLSWWRAKWLPFVSRLEEAGLNWQTALATLLPSLPSRPSAWHPTPEEIELLRKKGTEVIRDILRRRHFDLQLETVNARLDALIRSLEATQNKGGVSAVAAMLRATRDRAPDEYSSAYRQVSKLHELRPVLGRRRDLLGKLRKVAPAWADAISQRQDPHHRATPPGDPASAWLWKQLNSELEKRTQTPLDMLQREEARLRDELLTITRRLIHARTWAQQIRRTGLKEQQALTGYADLMRRIGRGTGTRAPKLRRKAQQKIRECRSAVPVWIMPLSRVVETFDPQVTRFDVVILDEASQCDVMGLLALYLGKKVLVVGDHEQVSPDAVGQNLDVVSRLIDEHLEGVPNGVLYDGQMSIYDLARQSFSGMIMLVEHYRCVPDIIQFSNTLSYAVRIRPLREDSHSTLKPAVIPYRVTNAYVEGRTNSKEAEAVVSLILACIEREEYRDKSFGVISLVGDDQAYLIEKMLRTRLPADVWARHNFLCGNPAHFQGDERNVVFLSMVDVPDPAGTQLPLRSAGARDMFKKRYNVAASRAQDQLWVVYSVDPHRDLKIGDLRRQLIEFALDPKAVQRQFESIEARTQSPFEAEVARRLVHAGYTVEPQKQVGYYYIDLVVEDVNGNRIAIECDGDRFHPLEKLQEDMERQATLERLGWRFIRIRGSEFYRDPDTTTARVLERLAEMDIRPLGVGTGSARQPTDEGAVTEAIRRRAAEILREGKDTHHDLDNTSHAERYSRPAVRPDPDIRKGLKAGPASESASGKHVGRKRATPSSSEAEQRTPSATDLALKYPGTDDQKTPRETTPAQSKDGPTVGQLPIDGRFRQDVKSDEPPVRTAHDGAEELKTWVMTIDSPIWFGISRWAKVNNVLQPWERSLLYSIGRLVGQDRLPSQKQANHAKRLYETAIQLGFDPEKDVRR